MTKEDGYVFSDQDNKNNKMSRIDQYDILIFGAGPAGCTTAILLSKKGFRVAIIHSNKPKRIGLGECLPPESKPLLDQLGLWSKLRNDGHRICHGNLAVWENNSLYSNEFIYSPWGHGWQLDREAFDRMLLNEAKRNGTDILSNTKISNIHSKNNAWLVNGADKHFIVKFLVDASGRSGWISHKLGARRHAYDNQIAIVGKFQNNIGNDNDSFTLVEASENGWWYTSSLPNGNRIVIFFTDPINAHLNRDRFPFLNEISKTTHISKRVFPHYIMQNDPLLVPANTTILDNITGYNWLAVGDSAITHDPISSYGLTFALQTGFKAVSSIVSACEGDRLALHKYEEDLNHQFMRFLLQLQYIYSKSKFSNIYWKNRYYSSTIQNKFINLMK